MELYQWLTCLKKALGAYRHNDKEEMRLEIEFKTILYGKREEMLHLGKMENCSASRRAMAGAGLSIRQRGANATGCICLLLKADRWRQDRSYLQIVVGHVGWWDEVNACVPVSHRPHLSRLARPPSPSRAFPEEPQPCTPAIRRSRP